jgi:hypothetical protein
VLSKVSPKISKAKPKPFGGYSIAVNGIFGNGIGSLVGSIVTDSMKSGVVINFVASILRFNSFSNSLAGTEFHQIVFQASDGVWDVGNTATDCTWSETNSGVTAQSCVTITAIDCAMVIVP